MRTCTAMTTVVVICLTGPLPAVSDARDVLRATRAAIGGPAALERIHSLRMEGRSVRVLGPLKIASAVALTVVRPDRYVRTDVLALAGSSAEAATGFDGERSIQRAAGRDGIAIDPVSLIPAAARGQAVHAAAEELRRDLRLVLLGYFADAFDSIDVVADYQGVAEAPDGRADAIRFAFAGAPDAVLFTDAVTRLPLMVSWEAADTLAPLRALRGSPPPTLPSSSATRPTELPVVQHRIYFSDYRQVGDVRWPFVVRRAIDGAVVEELRFDRISINPSVDPKLFATER